MLLVVLFHGFGGYAWIPVLGDRWGRLAEQVVYCGRYGVQVFFVLSGFLITGLLFKARERRDFYQNFYIRRVLRIVPVYLVVLAVLKLWHVVDFGFVLAAVLFLANFAKLFGATLNEYGSLWSLAVEEHFYLMWPSCVRRFKERTLYGILLAVIVGEPLLRVIAVHISARIDIHFKTPFVLDFLAYGALLSLLIRSQRIHLDNVVPLANGILAVSFAPCVLAIWFNAYHANASVEALSSLPFTWSACAVLLLGLKRDHGRIERGEPAGSHGLLPFYGYISYGLYLIHVLVYMKLGQSGLLGRHIPESGFRNFAVFATVAFCCMAVSTGIAYISRRYFEAPLLGLKEKWQDRFAGLNQAKSAMSAK